jgi:hypothetical protein
MEKSSKTIARPVKRLQNALSPVKRLQIALSPVK